MPSMSQKSSVSSRLQRTPSKGGGEQPGRAIRVIGVPLDLGASRRGVDMGPSAVRVAGLEARLEALGHRVSDAGNIRVEIAETRPPGSKNAHYLKEITETCTRTAEAVISAFEAGTIPLLLGGDLLMPGHVWSGRILSPKGTKDRPSLDRRTFRHQYARDFAVGERSRHASGRTSRVRAKAARLDIRLHAQNRCQKRGPHRRSRHRRRRTRELAPRRDDRGVYDA